MRRIILKIFIRSLGARGIHPFNSPLPLAPKQKTNLLETMRPIKIIFIEKYYLNSV
jgi:hypothetical protein